jgi:hypothetical protein
VQFSMISLMPGLAVSIIVLQEPTCSVFWSVGGIYLSLHDVLQNCIIFWPHSSFSRMFIIVPFGKAWCIVKKGLSVTDATVKEEGVCLPCKQFAIGLLWSSGVMEHQKL